MDVTQLRPGLWRWTAPHPEWKPENDRPDGWGRMVGCIHYEPPESIEAPTILIDPQAPEKGGQEAETFWKALDDDVARSGRRICVLLTSHYHERSAQIVKERYRGKPGVEIVAHE